jgi:hypothetical protein
MPSGYGQVSDHPLCGSQAGSSVQIAGEILKALSTAIPRPVTRYYTEFSTVVQDDVWPMLYLASRDSPVDLSSVVAALTSDLNAAASCRAPAP